MPNVCTSSWVKTAGNTAVRPTAPCTDLQLQLHLLTTIRRLSRCLHDLSWLKTVVNTSVRPTHHCSDLRLQLHRLTTIRRLTYGLFEYQTTFRKQTVLSHTASFFSLITACSWMTSNTLYFITVILIELMLTLRLIINEWKGIHLA